MTTDIDIPQEQQPATQPAALRVLAKLVSYIFHPLFIPTYIFIWLMLRFPYEFAGITEKMVKLRLLGAFWTTAFFPAFAVFLLWRLKFVESILLRTQKERIVPYIITMFFYWWMWYLSRNFTDQPIILKSFYLGIFFTTVLGLIGNVFFKISMHAMGIAGGLCCVIATCFLYHVHLGADIAIVTLVAGLVGTSRLLLNDHSPAEVYAGIIVSILCQLLAWYFVFKF
ncbi:hypothetical protein [Deminuibacter soli]|uniref:PAP2 family protein n=1 Tax=Deminuibacter soli TaxID=2291815 RepID=A0A3E1NPT4_9BACT|nr:hypothetical protein [Deminuibacter soli]RFM29959.1 hypothetical protein DXN05_03015 [Deminuibacter soli]